MSNSKLLRSLFYFVASLSLFATFVQAQLIPASSFFERSAVDEIKISPDGSHIAITVSGDEESSLIIINLTSGKFVASFDAPGYQKIGNFYWVNEERIVFSTLVVRGGLDIPFPIGLIYALNIDNTRKYQLVSLTRDSGVFFISNLIADDPDHIRVIRQQVRRRSMALGRPDSYLLDVYRRPGRSSDNLSNRVSSPLRSGNLYSDSSGNPRVAAGKNDSNTFDVSFLYETDWIKIESFLRVDNRPLKYFDFVGFNSRNSQFYYIGVGEQGVRGLYLYDHQLRSNELLFQHPSFDIDREAIVFASDKITILGVKFVGDVFEQYYFGDHPEIQLHQSLDAAFPGEMMRITSSTLDGAKAVVGVFGPKRWGDFFLLDTASLRLEPIMNRSDLLLPELMAEVSPFAIRATDGLVVHGYITKPKEASGPVPMIVIPHGGPIGVRDSLLFNREAQFFANHGFAVLQINFRGSGGYGVPFEESGYREWGLGIIDDITQATNWAIQTDIADQDKICIYGSSFGAYAAFTSVVREPDLYRCAIGYAGVYDLTKMDRSDIPWQLGEDSYLEEAVGVNEGDLRAQSPVYNADKINVPILIAHGGQDRRAPPFHARDMREALEDEGKEVEWLYESAEGHGFYSTENNVNFYNEILAFLNKHLN